MSFVIHMCDLVFGVQNIKQLLASDSESIQLLKSPECEFL